MANNQALMPGLDNVDYALAYGYPATAKVAQWLNDSTKAHVIIYSGANGGLFANAPNGSILINITGGASHIEIKGDTGVWAVIA